MVDVVSYSSSSSSSSCMMGGTSEDIPTDGSPVPKRPKVLHVPPHGAGWIDQTQQNQMTEGPTMPPRPDFFSPTSKHSSQPYEHNGTNGASSSSSSTTTRSLSACPNGLMLPSKKRARTTDIVEDLLDSLHMDTGDSNSTSNIGERTRLGGTIDSTAGDDQQYMMSQSPTPSPGNCAAVGVEPYPSPRSSPREQMIPSPHLASSNSTPSSGSVTVLQNMLSYHSLRQNNLLPPASSGVHQQLFLDDSSHPSLVDPIVLTHLQQHVPLLPTIFPGLSAELLALMVLSRCQLTVLPSGGPLTQEQFVQALKQVGCENDQQLQSMLHGMIVEWCTVPAASVASTIAGSSTGSSTPATSVSASSSPAVVPAAALAGPMGATRLAPAFKTFYAQCFYVIKRLTQPPFKKTIDLATGKFFLKILLEERYKEHMYPFLRFLDHREAKARENWQIAQQQQQSSSTNSVPKIFPNESTLLSYDKWSLVLEWCCTIHPYTLSGYEPDGPWPALFDEFVEWLCERAPTIRVPESTLKFGVGGVVSGSNSAPATTSSSPRASASPHYRSHSRLGFSSSGIGSNPNDLILPLDADECAGPMATQLLHHPNLPMHETPMSAGHVFAMHTQQHLPMSLSTPQLFAQMQQPQPRDSSADMMSQSPPAAPSPSPSSQDTPMAE